MAISGRFGWICCRVANLLWRKPWRWIHFWEGWKKSTWFGCKCVWYINFFRKFRRKQTPSGKKWKWKWWNGRVEKVGKSGSWNVTLNQRKRSYWRYTYFPLLGENGYTPLIYFLLKMVDFPKIPLQETDAYPTKWENHRLEKCRLVGDMWSFPWGYRDLGMPKPFKQSANSLIFFLSEGNPIN